MKTSMLLFVFLAVACCSCSKSPIENSVETDSIDTLSQTVQTVDSIIIEATGVSQENLLPFKSVIDTLNSTGDVLVHSEYFLYDITGDGSPELWVRSGRCEADMDLWVYSADNGNVRKIFSDYGGHTDFFLNGNTIGSVTCNTGSGYVSIYSYNGRKIQAKTAEFSMWNEEGEAKAIKKKEQAIIEIWNNSETDIQFDSF